MPKNKQGRGKERVKAGTSKAEAAKRRTLFVEAYVANGGNATQAAITAGYSPNRADVQGARLLGDARVSSEVGRRRGEAIERAEETTDLTVAGVLRELHSIVHGDLRGAFNDAGALLPPKQWPDAVARMVASVKVVEMAGGMKVDGDGLGHVPMYTKEVKLWDKNSGIDKAMKHLGLFEKDNKQSRPVLPPILNIVAVPGRR